MWGSWSKSKRFETYVDGSLLEVERYWVRELLKDYVWYRLTLRGKENDYIITTDTRGRIEHGRTHIPDGLYMKVSDGPIPAEIKERLGRGFDQLPQKIGSELRDTVLKEDADITCFQLEAIAERVLKAQKPDS